MNGSRVWVRWASAAALLGAAGVAAPARGDDAPALPRYRLKVGQELVYRGESSFKYQNGSFGTENLDRAWVTRQNADGSWRVVLCFRDKTTQKRDPEVTGLKSAAAAAVAKVREATQAAQKPEGDDDDMTDAHLGACDLYPDGRVRLDESIIESHRPVNPYQLFPPLPTDSTQAKGTWQLVRAGRSEGQIDYRMADPSGACVIVADTHSLFDKIYLSSANSRLTFDPARGLITRVDSMNTQGYGFEGEGTGELVLAQVIDHDAAWVEAMVHESDTYFAAWIVFRRAIDEAMTKLGRTRDDVKPMLAAALEPLKTVRGRLTLPIFTKAIDVEIKQQEGSVNYYVEEAESIRKVIGQDAADWELKDLAGNTHAMREFRGRVVVLDFWYRGCGWCVRAMPQMKQLADDFRDQPVAILGLNKDEDIKDARFVADAMGLNYTTLTHAMAEPEKYHVRGFPTLVVVDPQGKVAEFHVGYSPTLRADVGAMIRRLLPTDTKAALASPKAN